MREILFKAKRVDNKEWIEGSLIVLDAESGYYFITEKYLSASTLPVRNLIYDNTHLVIPETLCQYTGLTDKNGNKIWENDVVSFKHEKFDFDDGLEPWERTCLPNKKEYKRNYAVEFCNTPTHYGLRFRNGSIWFMVHRMTIVMHDAEVIGNIFDNPELVKAGD